MNIETDINKIIPPIMVFIGGISFITNQTQIVPSTLSIKKINATSCAGAYFGDTVSIMKGIGRIIKHISNKRDI